MFEGFPYTNFHDLNLDWIIEKVKECYSPDNPPDDVVLTVNGETGDVILYKNAQVELPNIEEGTWNIFRVADGSIEGIQFQKNTPLKRINGLHRFAVYDEGNPPPYPVTSVNGRTGNVTVTIPVSSVGGLTGDVAILDTEIVTQSGTQKIKILFPVSSVDGQTGTVHTWGYTSNANLKAPVEADADSWGIERDIPSGSLGISLEYDDTEGTYTGYLTFKEEGTSTVQKLKILTPNEIPSSSGVVSINGATGVVILTGEDIKVSTTDQRYIDDVIADIESDIGDIQDELLEKTDQSVITATPETGTTATQNYSVGDYILINGVLYKAIANISISDTFTSSNVETVTVGDELTSLAKHFTSDESIASLTLATDATTTTTTVNTYSSRKFSDYQFIIAALYTSASDRQRIRDVKMFPSLMWNTGRSFDLFAHHGGSFENFSMIHIGYVSDTSFTVQAQAGGNLVGYQLWGFMKKSIN